MKLKRMIAGMMTAILFTGVFGSAFPMTAFAAEEEQTVTVTVPEAVATSSVPTEALRAGTVFYDGSGSASVVFGERKLTRVGKGTELDFKIRDKDGNELCGTGWGANRLCVNQGSEDFFFDIDENAEKGIYIGSLSFGGSWGCVLAGTEIMLADGSVKKVEDLSGDENIKTFNFHTGSTDERKLCYVMKDEDKESFVMHICLENGAVLDICDYQCFFDMNALDYFELNENNWEDAIGTEILYLDGDTPVSAAIEDIETERDTVDCYELFSEYDKNFIANGLLSLEPDTWLPGVYTIGEDLTIDEEQYEADAEEYGLYTYDEFEDLMSEYAFEVFGIAQKKISVGKGYVTEEWLFSLYEEWMDRYGDSCAVSEESDSDMLCTLSEASGMQCALSGASVSDSDRVYQYTVTYDTAENLLTVPLVLILGDYSLIEYDPQNGEEVFFDDAENGTPAEEPEKPSREGFVFRGWYPDPSGAGTAWNFDEDTVTDHMKLYAVYKKANSEYGEESHSYLYNPAGSWTGGGKEWRYTKPNGEPAVNEWQKISVNGTERWYHFGPDGLMDTGWLLEADGSWYYLEKREGTDIGTMRTGWMTDEDDGHIYYLDPVTGKMATGHTVIDGKEYYFNENVPAASGWHQNSSGDWIYEKRKIIPLGALLG